MKSPRIAYLFFLLFLVNSCHKADRDTDTSVDVVRDNALANFIFNDWFVQAHQLALSDSNLNSMGWFFDLDTNCVKEISHTSFSGIFPDTIIINYGGGGICLEGHRSSGKLKFIFSGKYGVMLKTITIEPENYFLNDHKIEGKMTITSRGKNSAGKFLVTIDISKGVFSYELVRQEFYAPVNGSPSFSREWVSGDGTPEIVDDVFALSGTYGGIGSKGTKYTTEIKENLKRSVSCKWMTEGKERIFPLNLSPRNVNYGSGCDNKSLVEINGKELDVMLLP